MSTLDRIFTGIIVLTSGLVLTVENWNTPPWPEFSDVRCIAATFIVLGVHLIRAAWPR